MSLSLLEWPDRLTLIVHPHRAVLERRPLRGESVRQESAVPPATPGEAAWQPALAAGFALLDVRGKQGGALDVVIADHFVRYAQLPWSDTLCSPAARREMGRALLKSSFGEKANALEITVDRPAFGRPGLAAGIDRDLLAALRAGAKARRLRLASTKPRLIAELAERQKEVGNGWFASIDRDWLTLTGFSNGNVVCLHNHRLFIAHGDVPAPSRLADWETTCRPYRFSGAAHAHA